MVMICPNYVIAVLMQVFHQYVQTVSSSSNRAQRLNVGISRAKGTITLLHHPRSIVEDEGLCSLIDQADGKHLFTVPLSSETQDSISLCSKSPV